MSFGESVRATRCPYAGLAVWSQIVVEPHLIEERGVGVLEEVGVAVRDRILADGVHDLDMLAIELNHPSIIGSLDDFTATVALFVRGLLEPGALPDPTGADEWIAYAGDERLFIFTLCPFYGDSHPRRSATSSAFIVIQFLNSFRKINMHRMSLAEKRQLSEKVKAVFTNAGVSYFAYITQGSSEALKLVKPLKQGDPPIQWWRTL
jgi:hypothetical protein